MVSVGGQIPQNLAKPLHDRGARVLGTSPDDIDRAEDRHKFSMMLDDLGVDQPAWKELQTVGDAQRFAGDVGYPARRRRAGGTPRRASSARIERRGRASSKFGRI